MSRILLVWAFAFGLAFGSVQAAPATFRAPGLEAAHQVAFGDPLPKAAAAQERPGGRLEVATVRALPKAERIEQWQAIGGGFVTRFDAASNGAEGLRVKLDVSTLTQPLEVRVQGADGPITLLEVQPGAKEAWTPWTEGPLQAVELFSRAPQGVLVPGLLHFTASPFAKAAASCTVPTMCTTNNPTLDAAIAQAKKASIKIQFVSEGRGFLCSATLIDTPRRPAGYLLTANHCITIAAEAGSVTSFWFYENTACDAAAAVNPAQVQLAGGTQLVVGDHNVDATLLLMQQSPPTGAVYARMDETRVPGGTSVVSLSHPQGDTSRVALGTMTSELRIFGFPQSMYGVRFSRGITEGGSSGSGLFTLSGGELRLRGVLSGSTVRNPGGLSCTNLEDEAVYGRLDVFQPEIAQYIGSTTQAADDAPNRHIDLPPVDFAGADVPLNVRVGALISHNNRRIDYAGDVDIYRFILTAAATVSAWTEGPNLDTVGNILDSEGASLEANDDEQSRDNHFGITRRLEAGTYYVRVAHWEPGQVGGYNLRIRADEVEEVNRTALWWNSAEPGWGLNVNHQGNKLFATLFTYDSAGPMWLVMSEGNRQADGTYQGALYRTAGPAFNSVPFGQVSLSQVGTMRLGFFGNNNATLIYTIDGVQVTKQMSRQEFGAIANCTWSAFDRSYSRNYQDLWYNAAEPGWGVNLTHQGNILFATLFTYDVSGRGVWLVMSNGARTGNGFSGPLYRMSGPVFNAAPWTGATPTQVGTMTFTPPDESDLLTATLSYTFNGVPVTKRVQRQVFGTVKPLCD